MISNKKHLFKKTITYRFFFLTLVTMFTTASVQAGEPEYMKLNYKNIPAMEIKGYWDTSGVFVATDLEELPKLRRPKLRGEIQDIDYEKKTVMMFGLEISISDKTQFLESGIENYNINNLRPGYRVEVSCKVGQDGKWEARKIKVKDIKQNNKIKGSLTRIAVDGSPPDTIEIFGLHIILIEETDVNDPTGSIDY